MRAMTTCAVACLLLASAARAADEPVLGGPCDGCENVFVGLPETPPAQARIAPPQEPGEPLMITGTVRAADGRPRAGIVVYAYQTDARGVYPNGRTRHGRLRGWARTGDDGRYRFDTIRPGAYPGRSVPQHVHLHVIEPGRGTYYIQDIVFDDDPLLSERARERHKQGRGGPGLTTPTRDAEGVWQVRRDITLGENIPGYGSKGP